MTPQPAKPRITERQMKRLRAALEGEIARQEKDLKRLRRQRLRLEKREGKTDG